MTAQDDHRPLWKNVDPHLARRAGSSPDGMRTWAVAAAPHNHVTVTARRGERRDLLLTTGHVHVESLDHAQARILLRALQDAISWTWPDITE